MIMTWTGVHRTFVVVHFFYGKSVISTLEVFQAHFMCCRNDTILDRKSILLCVENSIQKGMGLKSEAHKIPPFFFYI